MRWVALVVLGAALVSCGRAKKDKKDDGDDSSTTVTTDAAGNPVRENAGTSDGVPVVSRGQPGAPGSQGAPGQSGQPGTPGPAGPTGGLTLFDAENQQIGVQLHDDDGLVAHAVLSDHRYLMVDRETGELVPLLDFYCLYEANDCSGACYVYDKRWLNLVLTDADGKTWVVDRRAANQGAKLMQSYGTSGGACVENSIGTTESYLAQPYTLPLGLSLPLRAPLYWDITN